MQVKVNDRLVDVPAGATVAMLLAQLRLEPARVAVVIGADILPREEYPTRVLVEGDLLELISFVGGGHA